jgi:hypothetical protein
VTAVVGDGDYVDLDPNDFGDVQPTIIPMGRTPDPLVDLVSLFKLVQLCRRQRFDLLHVSTPKASFLGALAGLLTGTPVIYVYRTCVYELHCGWKRRLHARFDALISAMADKVVPVSRHF